MLKWILTGIAVVILGTAAYFGLSQFFGNESAGSSKDGVRILKVSAARPDALRAEGVLVAENCERCLCRLEATGEISFLAEDGQRIEKGEVICRIESDELAREIAQAQREVASAELHLKAAEAAIETQQLLNQDAVSAALSRLEKAELDLKNYVAIQAAHRRQTLRSRLLRAEGRAGLDEKRLNLSKAELEQGEQVLQRLESRAGFDVADGEARKARASVVSLMSRVAEDQDLKHRTEEKIVATKHRLQLFEQHEFPMEENEKVRAVAAAKRRIEAAQSLASQRLQRKKGLKDDAMRRLEAAQARQLEMERHRERCVMKAPRSGQLVLGDVEQAWTAGRLKVGARVRRGDVIFSIPEPATLRVSFEIDEKHIGLVKKGQATRMEFACLPDQEFKGVVTAIAGAVRSVSQGKDGPVRKVTLRTSIDDLKGDALRVGSGALVIIPLTSETAAR